MSANNARFHSANETAATLGISVWTLRRWVREGRIGCTRLGGKLMRFSDADVREFTRAGRQPRRAAK
jgi:excisionase family DNA binding protein